MQTSFASKINPLQYDDSEFQTSPCIISVQEQMEGIQKCLNEAMLEGLQTEVVLEALKIIQENPGIEPVHAMNFALYEWVK